MAEPQLIESIMEDIRAIPAAQLSALGEMIHYYRVGLEVETNPQRSAGRFTRHSGVLSKEDAGAMLAVIEEDCERINANEW